MNVRRRLFFLGLIILFAGFDVAILLSHMSRWIGVGMIILGGAIVYLSTLRDLDEELRTEEEEENIASGIIHTLTFKGRLAPYLPLVGLALISAVVSFNLLFHGNLNLGSSDYVVLLLAAAIASYRFVPERLDTEKKFVLIFLLLLFLILVLPVTLNEVAYGPMEENSDSPLIYHLLARPTSRMVDLLGIESYSYVNEFGVNVDYETSTGTFSTVRIGLSCTGLYSVSIFVSAFFAFIFTEYNRISGKVLLILLLGVATSWVANILRMTIIIVVGSFYGVNALLWTHHNAGILIFMAWVGLFWWFMYAYLIEKDLDKESWAD